MLFGVGHVGRQSIRGKAGGAAMVSASPTLDLNFLSGALDPSITFTRASTATYFDSSGVMQSAVTNAPRFDYDPATLQLRGLLIEEARTNVTTNSSPLTDFTVFALTKTAAATTAPDSTMTGVRCTEDSSNQEHNLSYNFTPTANAVYTITAFAKANTRTCASVGAAVAGNWLNGSPVASFNLTTGALLSSSPSVTASSITNVSNGWFRLSVTATASAAPSGSSIVRIQPTDNTGNRTYQGDGVSSLYFWGAQVEVGSFPTSYIPTTSAAVTRANEQCRITSIGSSSWFSAANGALAFEYDAGNPPAVIGGVSDGSTANMIFHSQNGGMDCYVASVGKNIMASPVLPYPSVNKLASCYQSNRFSGAINGGAVVADATIPAGPFAWTSTLSIGCSPWALDAQIGGHMRRVRYWPRVLSNAELQSVTT